MIFVFFVRRIVAFQMVTIPSAGYAWFPETDDRTHGRRNHAIVYFQDNTNVFFVREHIYLFFETPDDRGLYAQPE